MNTYRVFYLTANARGGIPTMKNISIDIVSEKYKEITTLRTTDVDMVFREMNVVNGNELPVKLKVRSMCVGDIALNVETDEAVYCSVEGWTALDPKTTQLLKDSFL